VVWGGEFVGGGNCVLPSLFELGEPLFVAVYRLVALGNVSGIGHFNFGQRNFLVGIVARSDRVSSLEGHVLEHVREARFVHGILHRAGIHVGEEGEDRRLGTLTDDDGEAVRKFLHRGALFEGGQILAESERAQNETDNYSLYKLEAGFHSASTT